MLGVGLEHTLWASLLSACGYIIVKDVCGFHPLVLRWKSANDAQCDLQQFSVLLPPEDRPVFLFGTCHTRFPSCPGFLFCPRNTELHPASFFAEQVAIRLR